MKHWLYISLFCIAAVSCSKDGGDTGIPHEPGRDVREFARGDTLGLFTIARSGGEPGYIGDITGLVNTPYVFDGQSWNSTTGQDVFTDGAGELDVYAYYPYDSEMGSVEGKLDFTAYPFDVSGDQSSKESDFIWSASVLPAGSEDIISLQFKHLFCRVAVSITGDVPDDAEVYLYNILTKVHINLQAGTASTYGGTGSAKGIQQDGVYYIIVPAQSVPVGTPLVLVDIAGVQYEYVTEGEIVLTAGDTVSLNLGFTRAFPALTRSAVL